MTGQWGGKAQDRLDHLTKPLGSLGKIESIARRLVCIRQSMDIAVRRKVIFTFAADHGIAEEGVSLYPRSVTGQMVLNFLAGGAAVNVLARLAGADVRVIDAGIIEPIPDERRLILKRIGPGTRNFLVEDAMTRTDAQKCLDWGADVFLEEFRQIPFDLAGVGEMGIGNSTSAAAVFCACLGCSPEKIVGRGTGLDDTGLEKKRQTIARALTTRNPDSTDPLDVLSKLGGFEIGEMAGCFLAGASKRVPMLVDGFISTAAALLASRLCPPAGDYLFFSHCSAEGPPRENSKIRPGGHALVLNHLKANPILDLDMRLGEGTGAALAMHVLEAAAAIFGQMATFESAGVDEKLDPSACER